MELSEEEKKAIEKSKLSLEIAKDNSIRNVFYDVSSLEILLNIIGNQQKEIEENQVLIDDIKEHRIVYIDTPEFEEKFISKDKIREIRDKAEVMDYYSLNDVIDDLSKLIGDYEDE